ncbi:MAG: nucleotide exchange factor GrpE [Crocinitomicaceae bacterium]|nr:nucleotide exchange factor GrpE [Crocinitomicaceae bacterium]
MASSLSVKYALNKVSMAVKNKKEKEVEKEQNENVSKKHDETVSEGSENQSDTSIKEEDGQTSEDKYDDLNNRFLRLYAEFENFRKRTNKERLDIINNANADLLKDMIPVIDDFERAITNNDGSEDVVAIKEGFSLIYNKYKGILQTKGLKPMDSKGEVFDPEVHEAVANMPTEDKKLKGKIIDDVEKGYFLNEKVLRYAKVVVGQ